MVGVGLGFFFSFACGSDGSEFFFLRGERIEDVVVTVGLGFCLGIREVGGICGEVFE